MVRNPLLPLLLLSAGLAAGCGGGAPAPGEEGSAAVEGKTYGVGLTLAEATPLSEILAAPEKYEGQKVQVGGTVLDVCKMRGCWMELAGDQPFQSIRVKVEDGEIIFPLSAKGHTARAEGILEKLEISEEQAREMAKHRAEEQGEEFDPSSITGPQVVWRLKGLGAVIEE